MKQYAFSTGALFPLHTPDALAALKKAGFNCAEVMPQAFYDVSPDFVREALKTGIHVTSIHYPLAFFSILYNAHPDMYAESKKFSNDLLTAAKALDTRVIVVHPHSIADEKYFALLEAPIIDGMKYLAELCEKNGVTLGMENSPKGMGATPDGLLKYIELYFADCPAIKPIVDTTEACEASEDPVAFIKTVKPVHLHLSDFHDNKKHLPAGDGSIDWNGVKAALDGYGYSGIYTLEPSYRHYLDDIDAKLKKAYAFVSGHFC